MKHKIAAGAAIALLAFTAGLVYANRSPGTEGGLVPVASATGVTAGAYLALSAGDERPNLVEVIGMEQYTPSPLMTPTGQPQGGWHYTHYNGVTHALDRYTITNDGRSLVGEPVPLTPYLEAVWMTMEFSSFIIDSDKAAALAHAAGGAAASAGHASVHVWYQLQQYGSTLQWLIVYRDVATGDGFYAASVDANTGVTVPGGLTGVGLTLGGAASAANPTAWRADAELASGIMLNAPPNGGGASQRTAVPPGIRGLPARLDMTTGDDVSPNWRLLYYSPSLDGFREFYVAGGNLAYQRDITLSGPIKAEITTALASADARPPVIGLRDALDIAYGVDALAPQDNFVALHEPVFIGSGNWAWGWRFEVRNGDMINTILVDANTGTRVA